jgi:hypothetical protein
VNIFRVLTIALWRIRNYERIPRLPHGMLRNDEFFDGNDARVLARMGARDRAGIRLAMKRRRVHSIDELVGDLEHYRARRRVRHRLDVLAGRILKAKSHHPWRNEIIRELKPRSAAERARQAEIKHRLERARRHLESED